MSRPQPVSIGDRDVLVTVEGAVEETAPTGFVVETFAPLARPVWARREATGGSGEPYSADQLSEREVRIWTLPYRTDLDPDLVDVCKLRRLTYAGKVFDIVAAEVVGRRSQIRVTARVQGGQS